MPDYQKGKIYKIECNITGEVYIGSTCEPTVARRLTTHVKSYNRWKKGTLKYKTYSFDIIDRNNYQIYLIENYPCNNRDELRSREGQVMKQYKLDSNCINHDIPKRTNKEYHEDNKDRIHERQKQYYKDNKEKIDERHKQYYNLNKEKESERKKKSYNKNKECIKCECGSIITRHNKSNHEKTKKHIKLINTD